MSEAIAKEKMRDMFLKQVKQNARYWANVDGQVINDDCMLHELILKGGVW